MVTHLECVRRMRRDDVGGWWIWNKCRTAKFAYAFAEFATNTSVKCVTRTLRVNDLYSLLLATDHYFDSFLSINVFQYNLFVVRKLASSIQATIGNTLVRIPDSIFNENENIHPCLVCCQFRCRSFVFCCCIKFDCRILSCAFFPLSIRFLCLFCVCMYYCTM